MSERSHRLAPTVRARTQEHFSFVAEASVEDVFPLFGAFRERDWAPGWDPQALWPPESRDEAGMVFRVRHPAGIATWINTEFDPLAGRVAYVYVLPGMMTTRISIRLEARGSKTGVEVGYERTALEASADEAVRAHAEHDRAAGPEWAAQINGFLAARAAQG